VFGLLRRKGAILRLEGAVVLLLSVGAYGQTRQPWWWALPIILLPDLLLTRRIRDTKVGGWIYDGLHTYPLPVIFITISIIIDYRFIEPYTGIALLWFSHIGFDRLLGRGLKYDGAIVDDLYAKARMLLGHDDQSEVPHSDMYGNER